MPSMQHHRMRMFAWAVAPLLLAVSASGCVLPFCGTTTYVLSGVTAGAAFEDEAWETARAETGIRAAGFEPRVATNNLVTGGGANVSIYANGHPHAISLTISFPATAQGAQEDVRRAAEAAIREHEEEAVALMAAFARGADWTLDTEISWDFGTLHGDC